MLTIAKLNIHVFVSVWVLDESVTTQCVVHTKENTRKRTIIGLTVLTLGTEIFFLRPKIYPQNLSTCQTCDHFCNEKTLELIENDFCSDQPLPRMAGCTLQHCHKKFFHKCIHLKSTCTETHLTILRLLFHFLVCT